jgi:hypothetical protein
MSDMGDAHHLLGMCINRNGETGQIRLSQVHYMVDILKACAMEDCKPTSIPINTSKSKWRDPDDDNEDGKKSEALDTAVHPY